MGDKAAVHVPAGAHVVQATGKYLIPGLWNMHAHLIDHGSAINAARYEDFIANGLTGVREMAQRFPKGADSLRVWQREIMAGDKVGPRIVGPSADVSQGNDIQIETPEDARRVIDSLKAAGDAFVKYHEDGGDRDIFFALVHEAKRVGLPLVGHKADVTEIELSDSGQRSLEHINEVRLPCWFAADSSPSATLPQECATMAEHFVRNGTWFAPTLVRFDPFNNFHSYTRGCRPDSLPASHPLLDAAVVAGTNWERFQVFVRALGRMHRAGIQMLAGSDGGTGVPILGCALHVELALMVDAGFTPLEALQTATLNAAKFFNATDSLGTVAPGKLADLDLLDANPLVDIHNTKKIRGVMVNGHYFDRAALDALTAQAKDSLDTPIRTP